VVLPLSYTGYDGQLYTALLQYKRQPLSRMREQLQLQLEAMPLTW
jgi:hypothetical protein